MKDSYPDQKSNIVDMRTIRGKELGPQIIKEIERGFLDVLDKVFERNGIDAFNDGIFNTLVYTALVNSAYTLLNVFFTCSARETNREFFLAHHRDVKRDLAALLDKVLKLTPVN